MSERVAAAVKRATELKRPGQGNDEIYTHAWVLELARAALGGFDLDPASSVAANETVRAARIFDADSDGLAHPWSGRVWMNPPFSARKQFNEKLLSERGVTAWATIQPLDMSSVASRMLFAHSLGCACYALIGRAPYRTPDGERHGGGFHCDALWLGGAASETRFRDAAACTGQIIYRMTAVPVDGRLLDV